MKQRLQIFWSKVFHLVSLYFHIFHFSNYWANSLKTCTLKGMGLFRWRTMPRSKEMALKKRWKKYRRYACTIHEGLRKKKTMKISFFFLKILVHTMVFRVIAGSLQVTLVIYREYLLKYLFNKQLCLYCLVEWFEVPSMSQNKNQHLTLI
jgi:hypothetical protein